MFQNGSKYGVFNLTSKTHSVHTQFILKLGFKLFLQRCRTYITPCIYHLHAIIAISIITLIKFSVKHKLQFTIDPLRTLGQKCYMQNVHFLSTNLDKLVFHKNLDLFLFKYCDIHTCNMLFINNTLYKSLFIGCIHNWGTKKKKTYS